MNSITINGVSIVGGRSIVVSNGKIIIDGRDVTPETKQVDIVVTGNVERIQADACLKVSVTGDTGAISTQSGDVEVGGGVAGSVQTMSGDVNCGGPIGGSVTTMSGDIRSRP